MKKLFLPIALCYTHLVLANQPTTLLLTDAKDQLEIPFADFTIKNKAGLEVFTGSTDETGTAILDSLDPGNYIFHARIAGYPVMDTPITILEKGDRIQLSLGGAGSSGNYTELEGTVISSNAGQRVEQWVDKIIYNVENDLTSSVGGADQVLRKLPAVNVDLEGNLSMKGNSNVLVFIDGKPSTIYALSVADALKQIPANTIKAVEISHTPSAKYDAEGSGGVINIITKKERIIKFSAFGDGLLRHRYSQTDLAGNTTAPMGRLNGGVNFNHKKWSLAANAMYNNWLEFADGFAHQQSYLNLNTTTVDQDYRIFVRATMANAGLSTTYNIDESQHITAGYNYRLGKKDQSYTQQIAALHNNELLSRYSTYLSPQYVHNLNTTYAKKFANQWKIDANVLYTRVNQDDKYTNDQFNEISKLHDYYDVNKNEVLHQEWVAGIDVKKVLKEEHIIEFGGKYNQRYTHSDYKLYSGGQPDLLTINPEYSGLLHYDQNIGGLYGQYYWYHQKWSTTLGLRYESIKMHGIMNDKDVVSRTINSLMPNVQVSYALGQHSKATLQWNQRIERPTLNQLNPYANLNNPYNLRIGNPNLMPEKVSKVEVGYGWGKKGWNIQTNLFYAYTNSGIESITHFDEQGGSISTFINHTKRSNLGAVFSFSAPITERLIWSSNANVYYKQMKNDSVGLSSKGLQYDYKTNLAFNINKKWAAEGEYYFNGRKVDLVGTTYTYFYYVIGGRYQLENEKVTYKLMFENPFHKITATTKDYHLSNGTYYAVSNSYIRAVTLSASFKI